MNTLSQLQNGELKGVTKIKMHCDLVEFPQELYVLSDTLEALDLSGNRLSSLPDNFYLFKKLRTLFLSDNLFTEFPEVLGKCTQLDIIGFKANQIARMSETSLQANTRWLILTNNRLEKLPDAIGKCARMQKLMLAGNRLTELPIALAACKNLGLLRISANRLTQLPEWLFTMPKLSWIAFAGNPFCNQAINETALETILWEELQLAEQLGEGASGIIWKANWRRTESEEAQVAVKLFKGAVTSDGLPDDEMNACMLAGNHPNLVNVLGKVNGHPEEKKGLVLSLIPSDYTNLGKPPSLESCTRDVFDEETKFTIKEVLSIAQGIASAAAQLHERGVLHGDLYAHNILISPAAHALFGDFGAASIYDKTEPFALALEKIEVSAFGCLLEDLLNYTTTNNETIKDKLVQLKEACLQEEPSLRPDFVYLTNQLLVISY